jgi:uncharacterized protein YegP (UPF0339 family)
MATSAFFKIKSASGGWRAYFYGGNGELVWWTEVYSSYQNAENAVTFAKSNAASAALKP